MAIAVINKVEARTQRREYSTERFLFNYLASLLPSCGYWVHVMAQARVLESGTHQELLAKGGSYAKSWRSQVETSVESKV